MKYIFKYFFLTNLKLKLNKHGPCIPPSFLKAYLQESRLWGDTPWMKGCHYPNCCKTNAEAQWMHHGVRVGPHFHIKKGSRIHAHSHTRAPALPFSLVYVDPSASNAYSPSVCQASGTPIHSPIKQLPHLTRRGQGPCPVTLVCQLGWQHGRGPPPPFPAHQLCWQVQAGKGLSPPPHSCPSAHLMDTGGWGIPQSLSAERAGAFPPWVGPGLDAVSQSQLTGGGRHDSQLFQCLTGSYRSPTLIRSHASGRPWTLPGPCWMGIQTGIWKQSGGRGQRKLGAGRDEGTHGLWVDNW